MATTTAAKPTTKRAPKAPYAPRVIRSGFAWYVQSEKIAYRFYAVMFEREMPAHLLGTCKCDYSHLGLGLAHCQCPDHTGVAADGRRFRDSMTVCKHIRAARAEAIRREMADKPPYTDADVFVVSVA